MQKFRIALAVVVSSIWIVGYALAYIGGKAPPGELSGLMALVLGWAFAGTIKDSFQRKVLEQHDPVEKVPLPAPNPPEEPK